VDRIGVAAVEDDGIYFTVVEVDENAVRQVGKVVDAVRRPTKGFSRPFILSAIRNHFRGMVADGEIACLGISMFGLINRQEHTAVDEIPRHDWIPEKPGKADTRGDALPVLDFRELFDGVPIYVSHDSSAAAVGEWLGLKQRREGFSPGLFVRIRVGAGVGVGCVQNDGTERVGGSHPELGHLITMRRANDRRGTCRAHSKKEWDCIEGLVSEKAILERQGGGVAGLIDIDPDDSVWDGVAAYLARLCVAITMQDAPDEIVIGGRTIIGRRELLEKIQGTFMAMIGGYPRYEQTRDVKRYIRASIAQPNPASVGLLGAAELARQQLTVLRDVEKKVRAARNGRNIRGG
jgi:predicted NBD/HSP70 family sugar kinase